MTLTELVLRRQNEFRKAYLAADPATAKQEERELRARHERRKRQLAAEVAGERLSASRPHLDYEWTGLCTGCFM